MSDPESGPGGHARFVGIVTTADAMVELGRRIGLLLLPGDLVILDGELGAGKTTLSRGLGQALGVRGVVTSPTFVIARIHPSLGSGPALVHVDAYRLSSADDIDALDLDASVEDCVTVVEWGAGRVEQLADSWMTINIGRGHPEAGKPGKPGELANDQLDDVPDADGPRDVRLELHGPSWVDRIESVRATITS